jgi:hypothetical protein
MTSASLSLRQLDRALGLAGVRDGEVIGVALDPPRVHVNAITAARIGLAAAAVERVGSLWVCHARAHGVDWMWTRATER